MTAATDMRQRRTVTAAALVAALAVLGSGAALTRAAGGGPLPSAAAALSVASVELCAKDGTVTLPGGASAPIWGFARKPSALPCSDPSVQARLPGPVIDVNVGDQVMVTLTNALSQPVELAFPGMTLAPGPTVAAPGGSVTYTFTAAAPGTYLYESGGDAGRQSAAGLHGALIVRPATAGRAYNDASTSYDRESVVVLSELDPALNADPHGFNMLRWAPKYWLVNGKAYPDTNTDPIDANAGQRVLLRYVSAGSENTTMMLLGLHQRIVAQDAFSLPDPFDVVAQTIPSGATADAIVAVPSSAASGDKFALYNRQLHLENGSLGDPSFSPGGMMTFVRVP
jgi:FtsP/CotA-like multicopper oxidase with cupredoxin domain